MPRSINPQSDITIFSILPQAPLAQQALELIRQAIVTGVLKPQQPLKENEIAIQMGISRQPVREALLILEEEGLVERVPYKGTFVTTFSRQDVEELYSLRIALECFGIELLVPRLDETDLGKLRAIVDRMHQAAREADAPDVSCYDLQFHEYLMARTGHKRLLSTWQDLKSQIRRVVAAGNVLNEDLHRIAENHMPILAALEARDIARAKSLMQQHIFDSGARVIANLERLQRSPADGANGE